MVRIMRAGLLLLGAALPMIVTESAQDLNQQAFPAAETFSAVGNEGAVSAEHRRDLAEMDDLCVELGGIRGPVVVGEQTRMACCSSDCGGCGGPACKYRFDLNLTASECCPSDIMEANIDCEDNESPPCIAPVYYNRPAGCRSDTCGNGGACTNADSGAIICTCEQGFGGLFCEENAFADPENPLPEFSIELQYVGLDDEADYNLTEVKEIFRKAADEWEDVVTHVRCDHGPLLISIVGVTGNDLYATSAIDSTSAECPTQPTAGGMRISSAKIESYADSGALYLLGLQHMGHILGIGTLWEVEGHACSSCGSDGRPYWGCPYVNMVYNDLTGRRNLYAPIIEVDEAYDDTVRCAHFSEERFGDEIMTPGLTLDSKLSILTVACLGDLDYLTRPTWVELNYSTPDLSTTRRNLNEEGDEKTGEIRFKSRRIKHMADTIDKDGTVVGQTSIFRMESEAY